MKEPAPAWRERSGLVGGEAIWESGGQVRALVHHEGRFAFALMNPQCFVPGLPYKKVGVYWVDTAEALERMLMLACLGGGERTIVGEMLKNFLSWREEQEAAKEAATNGTEAKDN